MDRAASIPLSGGDNQPRKSLLFEENLRRFKKERDTRSSDRSGYEGQWRLREFLQQKSLYSFRRRRTGASKRGGDDDVLHHSPSERPSPDLHREADGARPKRGAREGCGDQHGAFY